MSGDPWRDARDQAATVEFSGSPLTGHQSILCPHCHQCPTVQRCRICDTPLCAGCRLDHYHEGYP